MKLTIQQLKSYKNKGFAGPNPILSQTHLTKLKYELLGIINNLHAHKRPENLHSPNE